MERKNVLNRVPVPADPVYSEGTLTDCNFVARVVVEPTGFFGQGKPIFRGVYDGKSELPPDCKVRVITEDTTMWYPEGEHADSIVNGHPVEEVMVTRLIPPEVVDPSDLDS